MSVHGADELRAVVLALKVVDRSIAKDIRAATVAMSPDWTAELAGRARSRRDARILLAGARIAGGNPPAALAGSSTRRLPGGGRPTELASGQEFGSKSRGVKRTYSTRSPKGTAYRVSRRTHANQPPSRPTGRVVYPAVADIGPRMVALWVQLVVRKIYDATGTGT